MDVIKKSDAETAAPSPSSGIAPIRVMVVDSSLVIRGLISRMLREDSRIEVVASAADGARAIDRVSEGGIDIVILDTEMPGMDGITAIPKLLKADPAITVIMASTLTTRDAEITMRALQAGAADCIPKPNTNREVFEAADFKREFLEKVLALGARRTRRRRADIAPATPGGKPLGTFKTRKPGKGRIKILAIGSSTGGPCALQELLASLPYPLKIPVVITQHMPAMFTRLLAETLSKIQNIDCQEAVDGEAVLPNRVLIAPGDSHMEFRADDGVLRVALHQGPKINFCRPAVDPMLSSLVSHFGGGVLCTILTGMGSDGLIGAEAVIARGGTVIAQDEPSSVVWGMPGAVARAGLCAAILPINQLGAEIGALIRSH